MHPSARPPYAVLIDDDNAPPGVLERALAEVAHEGGEATVRLVFGNGAKLLGERQALQAHGYRALLQFPVVERKNTTDIALTVAAMDLLHAGAVEGFCIVSSDSDFLPLVLRLREARRRVLVMGEGKTPEALRVASHRFVLLDAPPPPKPEPPKKPAAPAPKVETTKKAPPPAKPPLKDLAGLRSLFTEAYRQIAGESADGWVDISRFDTRVRRLKPDFSVKEHGRKQLRMLVAESGVFQVKDVPASGKTAPTQHLRLRKA